MRKIGFLYAGQGAQYTGMGQDFYEQDAEFRSFYDEISEREEIGFDVREVSFRGPEEVLNETEFTQPCMVAFQMGVTGILNRLGIRPSLAAGLSLGEYSALAAAGVFQPGQVVSLVRYRGKVMQEASAGRDTEMIAVLGLSPEMVRKGTDQVREEFSGTGLIAEPANYNCPGQITVSGDRKAVDRAAEVLKGLGAVRCLPVKVSGPFHTSLMKPAGDRLRERFQKEHFGKMQIPVVFNCLGNVKSTEDQIPDLLEKQVQSSVYFEDSLKTMAKEGVELLVEIGPGNTLSKFARKTVPETSCLNIRKLSDIENLQKYLEERKQ